MHRVFGCISQPRLLEPQSCGSTPTVNAVRSEWSRPVLDCIVPPDSGPIMGPVVIVRFPHRHRELEDSLKHSATARSMENGNRQFNQAQCDEMAKRMAYAPVLRRVGEVRGQPASVVGNLFATADSGRNNFD
ncbi:unnamed protein product [Parascedosporium putredinis]|uniref:Uncharacterized protein n=1 Tax=Parascedosporium putredinis TaxID=1442378 RepID=A0A9P1H6N9_9PEZI|nr:unnamed protein product [Parascedosporium putredinis]CAI7998843.1 unnamed protein product [Parascedosporium putredinis]